MQHVKHDLGQVKRGSTVVVTLDKQANVQLMDRSNYANYSSGRRYHYVGGLMRRSPARIPVPNDGHWYVAVDLGGGAGRIRSGVSVQPPPRGNLPAYSEPVDRPLRDVLDVRTPRRPDDPEVLDGRTWDVFISHASEDKMAVAIPLAEALQDRGVSAWLDKAELRIGRSLRRRIDQGLTASRFAVVVLSPAYFAKGWPQYELDGIVTLNVAVSRVCFRSGTTLAMPKSRQRARASPTRWHAPRPILKSKRLPTRSPRSSLLRDNECRAAGGVSESGWPSYVGGLTHG